MRRKKHYKFWSSLYVLIPAILLVGLIGALSQSAITAQATAQELKGNQEQLTQENQALKDKLEASYHFNTPENIKALSRFYIGKYFGKDAARVEKVMTCESGLSNTTINTKTGDYGLYQINARWHKARFESMYGVKFEIGAMDFELASRYAKFLYDSSGLSPWVCNRLVTQT